MRQINTVCLLVKKASNSLWMAVNCMKHPWKRQAEDCTDEECREYGFFLPLDIKRRTSDKIHGDGCKCNWTWNTSTFTISQLTPTSSRAEFITRKWCCRKETARHRSYSFWFFANDVHYSLTSTHWYRKVSIKQGFRAQNKMPHYVVVRCGV